MIVAVDFDKTLVEDSIFPSFNYVLKKNAKEVILYFSKRGIKFVLNTARYGWYRLPAIYFIKKLKLPIITPFFNKKVVADLYIDDRNLECEEINWLKIKKKLEEKCIILKNGLK